VVLKVGTKNLAVKGVVCKNTRIQQESRPKGRTDPPIIIPNDTRTSRKGNEARTKTSRDGIKKAFVLYSERKDRARKEVAARNLEGTSLFEGLKV